MNAWALKKHESIKRLVLLLQERLGARALDLSPHQGLGSQAIRLASADDPTLTAYLFSYGQANGRYGVHLEYPQHDGPDINSPQDIYEDLSIDVLADMLRVHFGVPALTARAGAA
jgi:hypothetical protein